MPHNWASRWSMKSSACHKARAMRTPTGIYTTGYRSVAPHSTMRCTPSARPIMSQALCSGTWAARSVILTMRPALIRLRYGRSFNNTDLAVMLCRRSKGDVRYEDQDAPIRIPQSHQFFQHITDRKDQFLEGEGFLNEACLWCKAQCLSDFSGRGSGAKNQR